jgi:hypothetical protein
MTKENHVEGVLITDEVSVIIEALERVEREAQTIVDQAPDTALNDEWEHQQGRAVSTRNALGMFRHILANRPGQGNVWTVRYEPSGLGKAVELLTGQPEKREFIE